MAPWSTVYRKGLTMSQFYDSDEGLAFIATADSRQTSIEIMRAIAFMARNAKEAEAMWEGDLLGDTGSPPKQAKHRHNKARGGRTANNSGTKGLGRHKIALPTPGLAPGFFFWGLYNWIESPRARPARNGRGFSCAPSVYRLYNWIESPRAAGRGGYIIGSKARGPRIILLYCPGF